MARVHAENGLIITPGLEIALRMMMVVVTSVTRSGDLLDFGKLLNAFGNT